MAAPVLRPLSRGLDPERFFSDKGVVVNKVLAGAGAETAAAYLGDDTTDEDAFLAIEGRGLGVLVRRELRRTRAGAWLRLPRELAAFLRRWYECGERFER